MVIHMFAGLVAAGFGAASVAPYSILAAVVLAPAFGSFGCILAALLLWWLRTVMEHVEGRR